MPAAAGGRAPQRRQTFPRSHRLKRRRLIRPLFDRHHPEVQTVAAGGVRLLYRIVPRAEVGADVPVQVGMVVSRRVARRAVQRNRIKRLLREAYRLHQQEWMGLFLRPDQTLTAMILYRSRPDAAARVAREDLPRAMRLLAEQVRQQAATDA